MLELINVCKEFRTQEGVVKAVDNLSFLVPTGSLFTLFGPSGCGKTTTLRLIAGLESLNEGVIRIKGIDYNNTAKNVFIPTHKRNLGMVFQSYAIWPHMNVYDNIAFPLKISRRRKKLSWAEINQKVKKMLELVQLGGYEKRSSTKLSGGQQQRLALARALIAEPDLLLLDEPLSNLDGQLRQHLRYQLKQLQRKLGITMIYVTHNQKEAVELSDFVAIMQNGRITKIGKPEEVF